MAVKIGEEKVEEVVVDSDVKVKVLNFVSNSEIEVIVKDEKITITEELAKLLSGPEGKLIPFLISNLGIFRLSKDKKYYKFWLAPDTEDYRFFMLLLGDEVEVNSDNVVIAAEAKKLVEYLKDKKMRWSTRILLMDSLDNGDDILDIRRVSLSANDSRVAKALLKSLEAVYKEDGVIAQLPYEIFKLEGVDEFYKAREDYIKAIEAESRKKEMKKLEEDLKPITSGGGGSGGGDCSIACYVGVGLAVVAVGAALWWGYNNFMGDGVSDEPIAIPDNY